MGRKIKRKKLTKRIDPDDLFEMITAPRDPIPEDPEERKKYLERLLEEFRVAFRDEPPEDALSFDADELLNGEPQKHSRGGR